MALEDVLVKKKAAVLKGWFDLIAQMHPDGGASLVKNKDRFANPVGYITSSSIAVLYEEILQGRPDSEEVTVSLGDIMRVRAVQAISPGQAVSFVFLLKKAIRAELGDEKLGAGALEEISEIESRIDNLASYAFDIYMDCRERINKVRVDEMKAKVDNLTKILERTSGTGAGI